MSTQPEEVEDAERDERCNALANRVAGVINGSDIDEVANVLAYLLADAAAKMYENYGVPMVDTLNLAHEYGMEFVKQKSATAGVTLN